MVAEDICREIQNAIQSPEKYSSGKEKFQLRVAFDLFCSQIYASIFNEQMITRMNARQRLNGCREGDYPRETWKSILELREAIRVSEYTLHARDYSDHTENIERFINHNLTRLYETVE